MKIKLPESFSRMIVPTETTLEFQKYARKYNITRNHTSLDRDLEGIKHLIEFLEKQVSMGLTHSIDYLKHLRNKLPYVEAQITARTPRCELLYQNKMSAIDKVKYAIIAKRGMDYQYIKHARYSDWIYYDMVSTPNPQSGFEHTNIRCYYFEDVNDAMIFKLKLG